MSEATTIEVLKHILTELPETELVINGSGGGTWVLGGNVQRMRIVTTTAAASAVILNISRSTSTLDIPTTNSNSNTASGALAYISSSKLELIDTVVRYKLSFDSTATMAGIKRSIITKANDTVYILLEYLSPSPNLVVKVSIVPDRDIPRSWTHYAEIDWTMWMITLVLATLIGCFIVYMITEPYVKQSTAAAKNIQTKNIQTKNI